MMYSGNCVTCVAGQITMTIPTNLSTRHSTSKDNTFVEGGMVEMQEAIQKRAMGEGSYMIPSFDYSAYSSIGIIQLNFILKDIS